MPKLLRLQSRKSSESKEFDSGEMVRDLESASRKDASRSIAIFGMPWTEGGDITPQYIYQYLLIRKS